MARAAWVLLSALALSSAAFAQPADCDRHDIAVTTTPVLPATVMTRERHAMLAQNLDPNARVIVIGDSIAQLWEDLATAFPGETAVNLGMLGDRTQNVLWRLDAMPLGALHPERVILILGTNNIMDKPCAVIAGMDAVIGRLTSAWPKAQIDVVEILPRLAPAIAHEPERQEINAQLRAHFAGRPNVSTLNLDRRMTCDGRPDCRTYRPDQLHPSAEGYRVLAEALRKRAKN